MDVYSQFGRIKTANKQANVGVSEFGVSSRREGKLTTGRPTTGLKGAGFQSSRPNKLGSPTKIEEDPFTKYETQIKTMVDELYTTTDLKKIKKCYELLQEADKIKPVDPDLYHSVMLQYALQHELAGDYNQSTSVYQEMIHNKFGPNSDCYLINIARNYYKLQDYVKAIKYYQMAHDKIDITEFKINCMKSIANIHMQTNQIDNAITVFNNVLALHFDIASATNLLICYFKLNKLENIKNAFNDFISIEDVHLAGFHSQISKSDELSDLALAHVNKYEKLILLAVKMMVKLNPPQEHLLIQTLDYCIDRVKNSPHYELTHSVELVKCFELLLLKKSSQAIDLYKSFELKELRLRAAASNNLTFLYLVQNDLTNAEKYCQMVLQQDMYNSKALTNMGCIYYEKSNFNKAIDYFNKALSSDSLCISALHNLATTKSHLQQHEGLKLFEKLFSLHKYHYEAMFNIL